MKWEDYYERFYDWAESTQLNRISSLTDFTSIDEIIEIVGNFDEKGASKLINKALSQGMYFNLEQILEVCEYLNKETTTDLIKQCKEKFTPQQVEQITEITPLWQEDILKLLPYIDSSIFDEEDEYEHDLDIDELDNISRGKKLGFFTKIAGVCLCVEIFEKILGNNDKD